MSTPIFFTELSPRPWIVCFSHLRWDFVYQRPQHLMTRAAQEYRVFYFEEPVFVADADPRLELMSREPNIAICRPILSDGIERSRATDLQREFLNQLVATANAELILWYYTPAMLEFSRHLSSSLCIFDNMDDLASFRGASPSLRTLEREMLAKADIVFTGGQSLFESKQHLHGNVHAFPSSIDRQHFAAARTRDLPSPPDQAAIGHPRLGFFGVIDERMDLALLAQAADLRPSWHYVMVGPHAKIDPASLPQGHNIHWLGQKPYQQLPAYVAGWDLGLMPFALNEATRFISPTKTPEFLAAGLPLLSTPVRDVIRPYGQLGLVSIFATADELVAAAELLLERPDETWLARVDSYLQSMSWAKTWREMKAIMIKTQKAGNTAARPNELLDV